MKHTSTWHSPLLGPLFNHENQNHPHHRYTFWSRWHDPRCFGSFVRRALPCSPSSVGWIDKSALPKLQDAVCIKSYCHTKSSGKGVFAPLTLIEPLSKGWAMFCFSSIEEKASRVAKIKTTPPPSELPSVHCSTAYHAVQKTQYWALCRSSARRCIRCWQMESGHGEWRQQRLKLKCCKGGVGTEGSGSDKK